MQAVIELALDLLAHELVEMRMKLVDAAVDGDCDARTSHAIE